MARKPKAGAGEPARRKLAQRPPAFPGRYAEVPVVFTPETVKEILGAVEAPGGPGYANLEAAASHLNDLVIAICEPEPPRPEKIAAWAKETATAANALLRLFGADPVEIARGGAVMPAEARDNVREILEPGMMLAPPESPLAGLAHDLGAMATHERAKALARALDGLAWMFLALQKADGFWHDPKRRRGGRNPAHDARRLVAHGAGAYRAATGREPGLNERGPALRFLQAIAKGLEIRVTPQGLLEHLRRLRRGGVKTPAKKREI